MRVEHAGGVIDVRAGQAVVAAAGRMGPLQHAEAERSGVRRRLPAGLLARNGASRRLVTSPDGAIHPAMPKTVVIVGGGFAGVECARRLERLLASDWQIVLFNAENHTTFTPLLAEVVGSSISPLHVVWTIRQTSAADRLPYGGDLRRSILDRRRSSIKLIGGRIARQKYDHLVLACGMVVNTDVLPGAAAHSFRLKTLGDALVLRNHLIGQLERAEVEPDANGGDNWCRS